MSVIIDAKNLTKEFVVGDSKIKALSDVNFTAKTGELTILKGRSGSGKTTLLNILGALDKPTEGSVFFGDTDKSIDIVKLSTEKRDKLRRYDMAFVFQSVALISTMTALENVELALRLAKYPSAKRENRAKEVLASVGLESRMHHFPYQLSGGEQQRVAVARALSHNPKVLFADEPTAELDSVSGKAIVALFSELTRVHNIAVIMTTHDMDMMSAADTIYTLEDGKISDKQTAV